MARRDAFRRVAPRLERAHRERRAELLRERDQRIDAIHRVLKAERLVAHRELQAVRAGAVRASRRSRARYVEIRDVKLAAARRELEQARAHARRLGAG